MIFLRTALIGALATGLAACGGSNEPASDAGDAAGAEAATSEFADIVEARQQNLKDLGGSFKAISDQLRSGNPDVAAIQEATETALGIANEDFVAWFPAGSGAESGLETDALPTIWSEADDFAAAHERLKGAAAELNDAALAGDPALIAEKFQATGGACKNCHDNFRKDDD